jgi:hypothetical protein
MASDLAGRRVERIQENLKEPSLFIPFVGLPPQLSGRLAGIQTTGYEIDVIVLVGPSGSAFASIKTLAATGGKSRGQTVSNPLHSRFASRPLNDSI